MKKTQIKTYIILAIFLSIIGISIAYAALSQQLQIKTNVSVQSSQTSWNIVVTKKECDKHNTAKLGIAEINGTTINMSGYTLQAPGDTFLCYFYVENKGEINAKLSSVNYTAPAFTGIGTSADADATLVKNNLWNTYQWANPFVNFAVGDILSSGEKKEIIIQYGLKVDMSILPTNPVTFTNAVYTINFIQA